MSISKYEVFSSVVELGSLTRAAEMLNLTQSGVSHAISSLENEFGFMLLTRDRSGISLTPNGERVLRHIREVLQWDERLRQEVAAINGLEVGMLRIGTFTSVSAQWLPGILKQFHNEHPTIEIKLLEGDYDEIEAWIGNFSVDFGFVPLPTAKSFEVVPLKKDRILCILPNSHPLSRENTISFEQIKEAPFIMAKWGGDEDIRRTLHENHVTPKIRYEVAENEAILAMVGNGLGISILPEMVISRTDQSIRAVALERAHYRTIGIAVHSRKNLSPAAGKFINCARSWLSDQNLLDFDTQGWWF
ncbi:MAG TPA: LysR family transcriptional regulator [Selenomonadales bacterium]|nr:LysR family transcriptional regulator [Selenomonadales bacterium]